MSLQRHKSASTISPYSRLASKGTIVFNTNAVARLQPSDDYPQASGLRA